jgi:hypothetical protein
MGGKCSRSIVLMGMALLLIAFATASCNASEMPVSTAQAATRLSDSTREILGVKESHYRIVATVVSPSVSTEGKNCRGGGTLAWQ